MNRVLFFRYPPLLISESSILSYYSSKRTSFLVLSLSKLYFPYISIHLCSKKNQHYQSYLISWKIQKSSSLSLSLVFIRFIYDKGLECVEKRLFARVEILDTRIDVRARSEQMVFVKFPPTFHNTVMQMGLDVFSFGNRYGPCLVSYPFHHYPVLFLYGRGERGKKKQ